jgi:hypothetical protein
VNTPRGGSEEEELLRRVVPADRPEPDQLPCRLYGRRHHRTLCSYYYVVFTYKHCTFAFTSYSLTLLCACRYIYIHTMHARSSSICVAGTAANVSVLDDTNYINLGSAWKKHTCIARGTYTCIIYLWWIDRVSIYVLLIRRVRGDMNWIALAARSLSENESLLILSTRHSNEMQQVRYYYYIIILVPSLIQLTRS